MDSTPVSKETAQVAKEFGWGVEEDAPHMELCEEIANLRDKLNRIVAVTQALRHTQKQYMAKRGDEKLGKQVAHAAERVDKVIAELTKK